MFSPLRRAISNNAGNPLPRKPPLADDLFNPHKSFSRVESLLRCFLFPRSSCIRVALGLYHPSILFCQHRDIRIPKESLPYQEEFQARTWLPGVSRRGVPRYVRAKGPRLERYAYHLLRESTESANPPSLFRFGRLNDRCASHESNCLARGN